MTIIDDISDLQSLANPVVTSGTFDGVHIGHQKILQRIKALARSIQGTSVVVTFWPHPRFVLGNGWGELKLLTTFDEKAQLLADSGLDVLVKVPFTRSFSELSSQHFIQEYIVNRLKTKKLVIGYDHRFGRNREGSFEYLRDHQQQFGFEIEEIPRQDIDHVAVSSTKIRKALQQGEVMVAQKLLGRPYQLRGIITKGDQLGRTMGYPTANIHIAEEFKLIPSDGVYAVRVGLKAGNLDGMMNIGVRPTISGTRRQIEVNIFDFDRDIYGQAIEITFVKMLREERKFENKQALASQLGIDKEHALQVLRQS